MTYDDYKYVYDANVFGQFVTAQAIAKVCMIPPSLSASLSATSADLDQGRLQEGIYRLHLLDVFPDRQQGYSPGLLQLFEGCRFVHCQAACRRVGRAPVSELSVEREKGRLKREKRIRINALCPGYVATDQTVRSFSLSCQSRVQADSLTVPHGPQALGVVSNAYS